MTDDRLTHPDKLVDKPWGYELIWAHTERYVGKVLHINKGESLSYQYHDIKDETIRLLSGVLELDIEKDGRQHKLRLAAGESLHIVPLMKHRMIAIEDCDVLEVSTPELDDVVRLEDRYGRADSDGAKIAQKLGTSMETQVTLAERLIERQMLSSEEMERVRKLQEEQQAPLSRLVVEFGFLSEEDLLPVMRDHFELPLMSLRDVANTPLPLDLPANIGDFFKLARMVPVKIEGRDLVVAIADPMELSRLHAIELATGLRVKAVLAKEKEIAARIEALYGGSYTADGTTEESAQGFDGIAEDEDVAHLRDMASEVPVIRLVNQMLVRALESRASDVHIEPFENQLKVRYRIDGILHEVESPPRQLKGAVISRLKILAQLNIAERRLPQDGRIKTRLGGKDIDLRIATVPTLYGESVVIRLLERGQIFTQLETMGFPPVQLARFNEMILKPHGMILVTGPDRQW